MAIDRGADYRGYVSWPHLYDATGVHQFQVVLDQGLKPEHYMLDVGCGSLMSGRYFMIYLDPEHYHAVEPNTWLLDAACDHELGWDILDVRQPQFYDFDDFKLSRLGRQYDYILAHSIFTHASQRQVVTIMQEAYQIMHDKSLFLATYSAGPANNPSREWTYPGGVWYRHDFIEGAAREAGLAAERLPIHDHPAAHTWVLMRKT